MRWPKSKLLYAASSVAAIAITVVLVRAGELAAQTGSGRFASGVVRPGAAGAIPSTLFGMHVMDVRHWPKVSVGALGKGVAVDWPYVEPMQGVFNWGQLDNYVNLAESHGVDFFFSNDGIPKWAAADQSTCRLADSGSSVYKCSSMVSNISYWDSFVVALVTRYKGKIQTYELWNEPNSNNFSGTINDMVELATHEYNIIRRLDPNARTVSPSGSPNYMDNYYAAGGPIGVDAVSLHSYRRSPEYTVVDIQAMQVVLVKRGLAAKPLWITEGSWGTDSLNEEDQTAFPVRLYLLAWSNGVARVYWYAWDNQAWGPLWDPATGLHDAGRSYQQAYNWLTDATLTQPCTCASEQISSCGLTLSDGTQALAVWNASSSTLLLPPQQYSSFQDINGVEHIVSGAVAIGKIPILIKSSANMAGRPGTQKKGLPADRGDPQATGRLKLLHDHSY